MKATFKTKEQFLADDFKDGYNIFYRGDKKNPDAKVRAHLVANLGGKEVDIVSVDDADAGIVVCYYKGRTYFANTWMFNENVLFDKIKRPKTLKLLGEEAHFYGIGFKFDCDFKELKTEDAVKLATWVLKMARDK